MSTAARELRIAMSPYRSQHITCYADIGAPTEIPGSFSQQSAEADRRDRFPKFPCLSKVYKAPSGGQNTPPALKRKASPSTPCVTHMPPTCWKPASTCVSFKKISVMPTLKPL